MAQIADFDQAQWTPSDQVVVPPPGPSAAGAFARGAVGSALPTAAGLAAFAPGAAAGAALSGPLAVTGIPELLGGLASSAIAGYGTGYAQQKLFDAAPGLASALGQDEDTRAADQAAHPIASFAGGLLPNALAFRPSLSGFTTAKGLANSALNATVAGATELGQQLAGDDPVDLTKVGLSVGAGALGNKETFIGRRLTGIGRGALPNDGSADEGAAGGAGAPADTSASNAAAFNQTGQLDLFNPPPAAQGALDLQGGSGTAPVQRPGVVPPQQGDLFTPQQGDLFTPPASPTVQPELALNGGAGGSPDPRLAGPLQPLQAGPAPAQGDMLAGQDQMSLPLPPGASGPPNISGSRGDIREPPTPIGGAPGQPQPANPAQGNLLPAPMFSPMEVLRQLRDAAGTPEKPATPDSFMLKLANGISQHIDPAADPDHKALDSYLDGQMQHLIDQDDFLKDKVLEAQTSNKSYPPGTDINAVKAQEMKPLERARTQIENQIATLSAAQDVLPDLKAQATQRHGDQHAQRVAPDVNAGLALAKERIAAGDTGGGRVNEPPSSAPTVAQMAARNIRDPILTRVLDDPTTLDPLNRFKVELRKAGVRDLALTPEEQARIREHKELDAATTPEQIPSSPNEMDPNLVPEAKGLTLTRSPGPRDQAALDAASAKRARQAAARGEIPAPPTRRADDVLPDANAKQGKLFTKRGQPTKAADQQEQTPAASPVDTLVSEAQQVLEDFAAGKDTPAALAATKGEPRRDVTSLREVVHEASRQGLLDRSTAFKMNAELAKPNPNLDVVRTTVAKAAKRGEAASRAKPPTDDEQAQIDAFMKRRDEEQGITRRAAQAEDPEQAQAEFERQLEPDRETPEDDAEPAGDDADIRDVVGNTEPPLEQGGAAAGPGMEPKAVHQAVLDHTGQWQARPRVQTHADRDAPTVPEHLKGRISEGAGGVYDPVTKTVHLFANNLHSPEEVHATLFHEALGHYGLRQRFGARLDKVLDDVYRTNPKMRELADQWIADAKRATPGRYDAMPRENLIRRAVEEVLAQRSEKGPVAPLSVLQRIASFVRDFARLAKIPVKYSDADVTAILAKAHDSVTRGPPNVPRDTTGNPPASAPTAPATEASPPLERNAAIAGGTPEERAQKLVSPELMKVTAQDTWTNFSDKMKRAALHLMDIGWLQSKYEKMFTVGGVPLIRTHQEIMKLQEATKSAIIQRAKDAHDLYVKLPAASQTTVADLLNDGRLNSVDVRRDLKTDAKTGKLEVPGQVETALRDRYNKLSDTEKAAFDGVRDEFDREHDETVQLFKDAINRNDDLSADDKKKALAEIDAKYKNQPGYVPLRRFGDHTVIGESKEYGTAKAAFEALQKKAAAATGADKAALDKQVTASRKTLSDLEDSHRSVTSFEKKSDAVRHAAELQKLGWDTKHRISQDFDASVDGVSSKFMKDIMDHLDTQAELNPDQAAGINGMKRMFNQLYLKNMPESSALKRQMTAKGVAGFSKDFSRVFAASTQQHAGFFTSANFGMQTREVLEKIRARSLEHPGTEAQLVYKQLKKNFDLNDKYSSMPLTKFMSNASYAYFLAASPSFGIMHAMQTPMVTLPMMAARFGYGKASAALASASKDVLGGYKKYMHPGSEHLVGDNDVEKLQMKMAYDHGLIATTETQQFMNAAMGSGGALSQAGRAVMWGATVMPHHIERANRMLTMKAALKLANADKTIQAGALDPKSEHYVSPEDLANFKATHKGFDAMTEPQLAAARIAEQITADSHVDYGRSNSSGFLSSIKNMPVISWAAQFQTYQFGMLKLLGENAGKAFNKELGDSMFKGERGVALRTLAGVLGTHGVMTGMMGLPGAGLILLASNMYHKFLGNQDTPFDAETSFRNTLAQALGKDAGGVAARGILYSPGIKNVLPADITDRLGMGDLGNFFNQTRVSDKINSDTMMSYLGSELAGPVGAMLGNFANMYQFAHEGQYQRALEEAMPKVLRDASKVQRFYTDGVTTGTGMPVVSPKDVSFADLVSQGFGFTPQKISEAYAQRSAVTEAKAQLQDRRSVLIKEYTRAFLAGDSDKVADVRNQVQAYNNAQSQAGLYTQRLNYSQLSKSVQQQRMAGRRLVGGVSTSPRDRLLRAEFGSYAADD